MLSQREIGWLNKYQLLKPQVDAALNAVADPVALEALVKNSTALAKAIGALQNSVKYRSNLGKGLPYEPGHDYRVQLEADALWMLSAAAADKTALDKSAAVAKAKAKAEEAQKQAAYRAPDAFPTLGQSAAMQPGKTVYTPPVKPVKPGWSGWGPPPK